MGDARQGRRSGIGLRTLLLLVLLAGGRAADEADSARRQRRAVATIERGRGSVSYDWRDRGVAGRRLREPPGPRWLRRLVGDDAFQDVVGVSLQTRLAYDEPLPAEDEILKSLADLPRLRRLHLDGWQEVGPVLDHVALPADLEELHFTTGDLSGHGLAPLKPLRRLRTLHIMGVDGARLTEDGAEVLAGLTELEDLDLHDIRASDPCLGRLGKLSRLQQLHITSFTGPSEQDITDEGLASLTGLTRLVSLEILPSRVTDRGLVHLRGLRKLGVLVLSESRVTPEGTRAYLSAWPDLVHIDP
jgi:hypothetical protein